MAKWINVKMEVNVKPVQTKSQLKRQQVGQLPKRALDYFKYFAPTPRDTGNARFNTSLKGNEIIANYPYAAKLDSGYSKQAPNGMSEPTAQWVDKEFKKIMGQK